MIHEALTGEDRRVPENGVIAHHLATDVHGGSIPNFNRDFNKSHGSKRQRPPGSRGVSLVIG